MAKHRRSRFTNDQRSMWYIDTNNLYDWAMMHKLPNKEFKCTNKSLDVIINTPDDSDFDYHIVCDFGDYDICKDKTEQVALMPLKRKTNESELGCIESKRKIRKFNLGPKKNNF